MKIRVSRRAVVLVLGTTVAGIVTAVCAGEGMAMLWQSAQNWLIIALAALFHEGGHAAVAWGCGVRIGGLRLDLFGARMRLDGLMSYGREFWVAAGGPLVNFMTAAIAYPFWRASGGHSEGGWFLFLAASLGLGCLNLLPVESMDGGRLLRCLVARIAGERPAEVILRVTTGVCLGALWLLSVYALLRVGQMLSLFGFTLCLLLRMMGEK